MGDQNSWPQMDYGGLANITNQTDNRNCTDLFDTPHYQAVGVCRAALSGISIFLCSCAILLSVSMKKWKSFGQRLVLYLLIASTLQSISNLLAIQFTPHQSVGFCKFSGYLVQTSVMIFLNAVFSITVYLFLLIVVNYNSDRYNVLYFIAIFLVPLLITWLPFLKDAYGRAGVWCWIVAIEKSTCKNSVFGLCMQYVLYYMPFYILLLLTVVMYLAMVINLVWRQNKQSWMVSHETRNKLQTMKSELLSLVAYPIIYTILSIPMILNRIYESLHPREPNIELWYLSGIIGPLYGIFTAVVFTVGTKMWQNFSCYRVMASFKEEDAAKPYPIGSGNESEYLVKETNYGTTCKNSEV